MFFIQILVTGFSLGITYGIIAIGFGLIVTTTRIFHIAHSATFLTGGYLLFILVRMLNIPLVLSVVIALVGSAILGLAVDKAIYVPIRRRGGGVFTAFIASMGVALVFEAIYLICFYGIPSVARAHTLTSFTLGTIRLRWIDVTFAAIGSFVYFCLYIWLYRTKKGLRVRGLADNASLGSIYFDAAQIRNWVFIAGSVLAGLGGMITAYDSGITPIQGMDALFVSIVALIVGGMGNVVLGTLVGGMVLGVVKVFSSYFFPKWFHLFVFSTLVLSVVIRPEGLVGRPKG